MPLARVRRNSRHARGFTLIEIMVVVIVLGVLAAIVIPNLVGRTDEARVAKAQSDIAEISTLLENFRLDMRRFPSEEEGLAVLREPPSTEDAELWKGPYARKSIPNDPWGRPYIYSAPAPNGVDPYGIESFGNDGSTGGDGFDKDINSWSHYDEQQEGEQ